MEESFIENLRSQLRENAIIFTAIATGVAVLIVGLLLYSTEKKEPIEFVEAEDETLGEQVGVMYIDVSGGVNNPGFYELALESRVSDAIDAAGGLSEDADSDQIQKIINLAKKLTDGEKVYIPVQSEVKGDSGEQYEESGGLININTADSRLLETLPGIGPVTAGEIIGGRPYGSIQELLDRKIVGQKTYEKIESSISVY